MQTEAQETQAGTCSHQRPGQCSVCGGCPKCRNDECNGTHPAARGAAGDPVRLRRKLAQSGQTDERVLRPTSAQLSLNEDILAKSVIEALDDAEPSTERPVREWLESLGMDIANFPERPTLRSSRYSTESLKTKSAPEDLRVVFERVIDGIILSAAYNLAEDDLSNKVIQEMMRKACLQFSSSSAPEVGLLADSFIRASQPLEKRRFFAHLVHIVDDNKLVTVLEGALARALVCPTYISRAKSRHYYRRRDEHSGAEEIYNEETPAATGTFKVTVTVEDQLKMSVAWGRSKDRKAQARADIAQLTMGEDILPKFSKPRVSKESIQAAMQFLDSLSVGWRGGQTHSCSVGDDCTLSNIPVLNMTVQKSTAWARYEEEAKKHPKRYVNGAPKLGRDSFYQIFDCIGKLVEEQHALSYYYTDSLRAIDQLRTMFKRMEELWEQFHDPDANPAYSQELTDLPFSFEGVQSALTSSVEHAKYGLRKHIKLKNCDKNLVHCAAIATGGACEFPISEHNLASCPECSNLALVGDVGRVMMNAVANSLAREHHDQGQFATSHVGGPVFEILTMGAPISACARTLNLYMRHVVRGAVMHMHVSELAAGLQVGDILINIDHKQKIEPKNFVESSEEYYGKKGVSLLGFMVRWRSEPDGPLKTHYVDAVSSNSKQDASQVQAILQLVIPHIKASLVPGASSFILISDNGSSFTSGDNSRFGSWRNKVGWDCGMTLRRWMFFEAQTGKTSLDTHFSYAGLVMVRFAREVRPVKNYSDVFDALASEGGILRTTTVLIEFANGDEDDDDEQPDKGLKIAGVRRVHEILFEVDKIITYNYPAVSAGRAEYAAGVRIESPSAMIKRSFTSTKTPKALGVPSSSSGHSNAEPAVYAMRTTSPHNLRIAETIVEFSTAALHVAPTIAFPVSLRETEEQTVPNTSQGKTKKLKTSEDLEEYRPKFNLGWADQDTRALLPLPPRLQAKVRQMVSSFRHSYMC